MTYPRLAQADVRGKRVLVRAGFDVPLENGVVTDRSRLEALVPTVRHLLSNGAAVILLSHQGRPKGKRDPEYGQQPVAIALSEILDMPVAFSEEIIGDGVVSQTKALQPGEVLMLENLRFDPREEANDPAFAKELARLGDVFVNDAFANCHRAHASMVGLPRLLPSFMGLQLEQEVTNLSRVLDRPKRPLTLVIGGAKMETKIPVIRNFLRTGDDILLGGAIANTFASARGFDVGTSLWEESQMEAAQEMMLESEKPDRAKIHVLRDAILASKAAEDASTLDLPLENIVGDMSIFDLGSVTIERFTSVIRASSTIVWNGPVGLYEMLPFSRGTKSIAAAIAEATKNGAVSLVGGGDTLDFHTRYGFDLSAYTFVSTGGGAMLSFVAGETLPALEALSQ